MFLQQEGNKDEFHPKQKVLNAAWYPAAMRATCGS